VPVCVRPARSGMFPDQGFAASKVMDFPQQLGGYGWIPIASPLV
jgi:hypothetical protein